MTTPLRTVLIGLDHYHVTGWVETLGHFPEQIEIVGRNDPNPARAEQMRPEFVDPSLPGRFPESFPEIPFYSDLGLLIRETRPELAMVTLPNRLAPDAIVELAQAECHLLVDKPGAMTAAGANRSVAATRANDVKMAVAFTRRYGAPWQHAATGIRSGRLGRLLTSEAIFVTSSVAVRDPRNPIFDRAAMGGGILHWLGVHDIDLIQWIAAEPIISVQAMMATMSGIDVEDTISINFQLAGGSIGTMHFAYALPRSGGEGYVALRGSDTSLRIAASGETEWIGAGTAIAPLRTETSTFDIAHISGYGTAGVSIVADLLAAISSDRDPLSTGEHARDALRVVDAIYESAATGRRVAVATFTGTEERTA